MDENEKQPNLEPPANPAFTDLAGRTWPLVLTVGLAQRIRDQLGVNFFKPWDGQSLAPLADPEKLVQVCWLICEKEATHRAITPEEFGEGFGGEQFGEAADAIDRMLVLFTQPARRPVVEAMQRRAAEVQTKAADLAVRKLSSRAVNERIEKELLAADRKFDQVLTQIPSGSLTSGPGSSG